MTFHVNIRTEKCQKIDTFSYFVFKVFFSAALQKMIFRLKNVVINGTLNYPQQGHAMQ